MIMRPKRPRPQIRKSVASILRGKNSTLVDRGLARGAGMLTFSARVFEVSQVMRFTARAQPHRRLSPKNAGLRHAFECRVFITRSG